MCMEFLEIKRNSPYSLPMKKSSKPSLSSLSKKTAAPFQIKNKIKVPKYSRPKSAMVYCIKTDLSKLLSSSKANIYSDVNSGTKPTSPKYSRLDSGLKEKRKIDINLTSNFFIPTTNVLNSSSSFATEVNSIYPINKYERTNVVNELHSAIEEYIAANPKENKLLTAEIPTFMHGHFPKGKIKHFDKKNIKSLRKKEEFPTYKPKKKSNTLKPSYFHLKRRYYPIKYKLNYIPRDPGSPVSTFLNKKQDIEKTVKRLN